MNRSTGLVRAVLLGATLLVTSSTAGLVADDGYVGSETCAACHGDVVSALRGAPHALAPGHDAHASCESCHGPGREHVESGGDASSIRNLGELPPLEASEACTSCHKRQETHFSVGHVIHRLDDVGCTDCHSPHSTAANMIETTDTELCASCHQGVALQFEMPRAHPLDPQGDGCVSCHNPHGTDSLRTSAPQFDATCSNCHVEKSGPFIYAHDTTMFDGCSGCHEVHGSPNRHLLKHEPQVNLCYQCHSASVTPTWHSVPRFLNEKCTACHSAIHGSNTNPYFLEE